MKRRAMLAAVAALALPQRARAQGARVCRVGVLMPFAHSDRESELQMKALEQGLREAGWKPGADLEFDYRWGGSDRARLSQLARELAASAPDVLLARGTPVVRALL